MASRPTALNMVKSGYRAVENWVPIDMIDLCRQMGVDLMERLRVQVGEGRT